MPHVDAEGRPLLELDTANGGVHLLTVQLDPVLERSPRTAVEVHARHGRVTVVWWMFGRPFRKLRTAAQA